MGTVMNSVPDLQESQLAHTKQQRVSRMRRYLLRGWWWKYPLLGMALLLLCVGVLWWQRDALLYRAVVDLGGHFLDADITLGNIEVDPLAGTLAFEDLAVIQTLNDTEQQVAGVGSFYAELDWSRFSTEQIPLRSLRIADIQGHLVRLPDGTWSLRHLLDPVLDPVHDAQDEAPVKSDDPQPGPSSSSLDIRADSIDIQNIQASITDLSHGDTWTMHVDSLSLMLTDFALLDVTNMPLIQSAYTQLDIHDVYVQDVDRSHRAADRPLLQVEKVSLTSSGIDFPAHFRSGTIAVDVCEINGVTTRFEREDSRTSNVSRGLQRWFPQYINHHPYNADNDVSAADITVDSEEMIVEPEEQLNNNSEKPRSLTNISVAHFALRRVSGVYIDTALSNTGVLSVGLSNGFVGGENIQFFSDSATQGQLALYAEIDQPRNNPVGYVEVQLVCGPLGTGVPDVHAVAQLTGFMLDTAAVLLPTGTQAALGASGADIDAELALNAESMNLQGRFDSDNKLRHPFAVVGPLHQPAIDAGPLLNGAVQRVTGSISGLGGRGLRTGTALVRGGVSVVSDLGKGTVGVAKNVTHGVFDVLAGVVTLDGDRIGSGAMEATVDVVEGTGTTIVDAGRHTLEGSEQSLWAAANDPRLQRWIDDIQTRHTSAVTQFDERLQSMPVAARAITRF